MDTGIIHNDLNEFYIKVFILDELDYISVSIECHQFALGANTG